MINKDLSDKLTKDMFESTKKCDCCLDRYVSEDVKEIKEPYPTPKIWNICKICLSYKESNYGGDGLLWSCELIQQIREDSKTKKTKTSTLITVDESLRKKHIEHTLKALHQIVTDEKYIPDKNMREIAEKAYCVILETSVLRNNDLGYISEKIFKIVDWHLSTQYLIDYEKDGKTLNYSFLFPLVKFHDFMDILTIVTQYKYLIRKKETKEAIVGVTKV